MWGGVLLGLMAQVGAPPAPAPNPPPPLTPAPAMAGGAAPLQTTSAVVATRLIYVPGVFARDCPSDADVRARTVANLGVDPFLEPAERTALLVVEGDPGSEEPDAPRAPKATRVRLELVDQDYGSIGARTLEGDERCDELVAAATLALAIALDPTRALAPPPSLPAPAPREPRVIVRAAPARDDLITSLLPEGTRAAVGVGGHGGVLLTPAVQSGAHLTATWRGDWWSLGTALRTDVPAGEPSGALLVSAMPCGHVAVAELRKTDALGLKACGTLTAGGAWLAAAGGGGGPYVGAGVRAGAEWVMADASALGLWAQVEWGLVRPGYEGGISADATVGSPVNLLVGTTFELGWPL